MNRGKLVEILYLPIVWVGQLRAGTFQNYPANRSVPRIYPLFFFFRFPIEINDILNLTFSVETKLRNEIGSLELGG